MCLSCSSLHFSYTNLHSRYSIEGLDINMPADEPRKKRYWTGGPETGVLQTCRLAEWKVQAWTCEQSLLVSVSGSLNHERGGRRERRSGGQGRRRKEGEEGECVRIWVCVGEWAPALLAPYYPPTSKPDSRYGVLPWAPLEGTLALHNSAWEPTAVAPGKPEPERSRDSRHSVPAGPGAFGLPEEETTGSITSQQKLRCGPLGKGPTRMWPILRNRAHPGFDSRRGAGFSASVQGGGPRRCGAGGARATRRPTLPAGFPAPRPPRPPRTCVRFTGPRGPAAPLAAPSLS